MKLTKEQSQIISTEGDLVINAVAGSGKTTTVIEYAKSRAEDARILYLAFNRSVKLEAARKFEAQGLTNVRVETAHSIAYRYTVFKYKYKVSRNGYKAADLAKLLKINGSGEKLSELVLANHVNKFVAYYCNSAAENLEDLNYTDVVFDPKAKKFAKNFEPYILKKTQDFLDQMDRGQIEITHDFYLKKFQLNKPKLPFDYILFDEGQDASAAMLDVVQNQKATKVLVGDIHQQIYGWRYAVNSLSSNDYYRLSLSKSFRFSQHIADLAVKTLEWKAILDVPVQIKIIGAGEKNVKHEISSKAILARTNLGLLLKAIDYVTENPSSSRIYFEGNFNSYTYANDGASLYDVLNLYLGKNWMIRDQAIKQMEDIDALVDYVKKTEDSELGMMVKVVQKYGERIPGIIKQIKAQHVEKDQKDAADMVFSTVHRCKGMEYDQVELVNDFTNEEKLRQLKAESIGSEERKPIKLDLPKIIEEINLLYVAITRAKYKLIIPDTLIDDAFPPCAEIEVLKSTSEDADKFEQSEKQSSDYFRKKRAYEEPGQKKITLDLK